MPADLKPRHQKVLDTLPAGDPAEVGLKSAEIGAQLGLRSGNVGRALYDLLEVGLVVYAGTDGNRRYAKAPAAPALAPTTAEPQVRVPAAPEIPPLVLDQAAGNSWSLYNADCVSFARNLPDNSVDLAVYSPPFSNLYVYSESVADHGNCATDAEFFDHYRHLVREKRRVLRPGRLTAIHVKDLVYYQNSSEDGSAGLRAFSDGCTKVHLEEGFTFHCRITIYRDPVLERAKTNAHGLLWKTFQGDSSFCRVGMPEYLMVYRKWAKPGEEDLVRPVTHPKAVVPLARWQDLASPVWRTNDIDLWLPYGDPRVSPHSQVWNLQEPGRGDGDLSSTDVLNVAIAKDDRAERHLCPMPLNITKRALELYTNKGDVVWSPYAGIGSEGVSALSMGRKFIGTELNPTYFRQAAKFLADEEKLSAYGSLFDLVEASW
ncbi:DNA methyltransferase [Azospirillum sp. A26]|uniref:DNA-methyltransferase n=1 Tax=Azospirillum sp. A26 TaxID=3160607 RepID=UPI00366E436C